MMRVIGGVRGAVRGGRTASWSWTGTILVAILGGCLLHAGVAGPATPQAMKRSPTRIQPHGWRYFN